MANEQMLLLSIMVLAGASGLLALALFRLSRQFNTLKAMQEILQQQQLRHDADLVGLCSAAIAVDRRMGESEAQQMRLIQEFYSQQKTTLPPGKSSDEPQLEGYAKAIQMIIRGASAEELVKSCGMTHDEAMLLISVNRSKD